MGKQTNIRGVLVRKTERRRPLGNSRCRWENVIRINPKRKKWEGVDWVDVFQGIDKWTYFVNMLMNLTFMGPCIVIIL
jgi:hypothetical protein